jgi:hypothetical protein
VGAGQRVLGPQRQHHGGFEQRQLTPSEPGLPTARLIAQLINDEWADDIIGLSETVAAD